MKSRFSNLVLSTDLALSNACEKSANDDMKEAGDNLKDAAKAMGRTADKVLDEAVDRVQEGAQR